MDEKVVNPYGNSTNASITAKFTGKVFLYMFIALLITAVVAGSIGLVFRQAFPIDPNTGVIIDGEFKPELAAPYLVLLLSAFIAWIPVTIWINIVSFRGRGRLAVPFVIYSIIMGVVISSVTMFIQWYLVALAFGITSVAFFSMFLIGYCTKRDLSFLSIVALGILFGSAIISLTNVIWMLLFPATFLVWYWFVSFGVFAFTMLITIIDANMVRRVASSGVATNNMALMCAFHLYVDFIMIFLRVLAIMARFSRR